MVITKKQIKQTTLLALLFAFCLTVMMPVGHAADKTDSVPQMMVDFVNSGVIDVIKDNLTSNNGTNPLYNYVMNPGKDATNIISRFANATKIICGFIIVIIAVVKYFQELDKGHDPIEEIYKIMSEICIVGILIANANVILDYTVQLGEWFIDVALSLDTTVPNSARITLEMISGEKDGGIVWWIQCFLILAIPWILTVLMQIVAQFTAFSIIIELGIRKAFAHIAICDIYSEGFRSPGVRYLKRFLATFIKIVICLLVCYLGQILIGASANDNFGHNPSLLDILQYVFRVIAINFTVIGVMNKTGEYANDIVGV